MRVLASLLGWTIPLSEAVIGAMYLDGGYEAFELDGAKTRNAPPEVRLTKRWHVPLDMDVISPASVRTAS